MTLSKSTRDLGHQLSFHQSINLPILLNFSSSNIPNIWYTCTHASTYVHLCMHYNIQVCTHTTSLSIEAKSSKAKPKNMEMKIIECNPRKCLLRLKTATIVLYGIRSLIASWCSECSQANGYDHVAMCMPTH